MTRVSQISPQHPLVRSAMTGLILVLFLIVSLPFTALCQNPDKGYLLDRALSAIASKRGDLAIRSDLSTNPFALMSFTRWMENPIDAPLEAQQKAMNLLRAADKPLLWLQELAGLGDISSPEPLTLKRYTSLKIPAHLPEPLREAIRLIIEAIYTAEIRLATVKKGISPEKMRLFERYLYPDFCMEDSENQKDDWIRIKELRETIDAAKAVDRKGILEAGLTIIKALAEAKELLTETDDWGEDVHSLSFETALGLVEIGGRGPDHHEDQATLIIDLGGNDLYRGKIASGSHGKCSVVIDLSGNDIYLGEDFTQASGFWGIGILFDIKGDDLYRAGNCSQGAGLFGIGLLLDEEGMDSYLGARFVQAASSWGWGGLIDLSGEDSYHCQQSGQAYSEVLGISSLCDISGNDKYISGTKAPDPREPDMNQSFSQGFAIGMRNLAAGGFAILADQSGNDLYQCQYFGQGSSYWMAVGILYDEYGKDTYIARRYAQGAGIHFSLGLLLDPGGDDHTSSWGVSQGCGHDYGIGILINEEGNDTYASNWLSMGASEANGVGIFVDNSGDDGYETKTGIAVGRLLETRRAGGIGLFIDAGGKDTYSKHGSDNSIWGLNRWGVGLDEDEDGMSGINILPPEITDHRNEEAEKKIIEEKERLLDTIAKAENMPPPIGIEGMLSVASHWGHERDLPGQAQEKLLQMEPGKSMPAVVGLLDTPNVLSLRFMERFFRVHAFHAIPELIKKRGDPDPILKSRAFYYLGTLKDSRALKYCVDALKDRSWRVRASAVRAIGEILNKGRLEVLIPMKEAFDEALEKNDPDIIKGYLEDDDKIMMVLSVLARAIPLDYETYKQYSDISSEGKREEVSKEYASKEYASFVSGHLKEMLPLLEKWISDIKGSGEVARALMGYLDDSDPAIKRATAYSLGQMNYRPVIPQLLSLIKDLDLWVRDAAALSLALFGDEAILSLASAMEQETSSFKIIALDVLARIKGKRSKALIEEYLDDPDHNIRRAAGRALLNSAL